MLAQGYDTFEVLSNMLLVDELNCKSFNDLVTLLTHHFHPMASLVAERYKFGCCRQRDSELDLPRGEDCFRRDVER